MWISVQCTRVWTYNFKKKIIKVTFHNWMNDIFFHQWSNSAVSHSDFCQCLFTSCSLLVFYTSFTRQKGKLSCMYINALDESQIRIERNSIDSGTSSWLNKRFSHSDKTNHLDSCWIDLFKLLKFRCIFIGYLPDTLLNAAFSSTSSVAAVLKRICGGDNRSRNHV